LADFWAMTIIFSVARKVVEDGKLFFFFRGGGAARRPIFFRFQSRPRARFSLQSERGATIE
jgi:hypothetical protein